jgi:hypothetical protein
MDAGTLSLGLLGLGVLLTWSAVVNQHPVDVIRSAFDRRHNVRELSTGAGRRSVDTEPYTGEPGSGPYTGGPTPAGLGTTGVSVVELYYRDKGWKNGAWIGRVPDHDGHVHVGVGPGGTWKMVVAYLVGLGIRPTGVWSTTGGKHAPNSLHYENRAIDFPGAPGAGPDPELDRVYAALLPLATGKATL